MKFIIDTEDAVKVRGEFRAQNTFELSIKMLFNKIDPEVRYKYEIDDALWPVPVASYTEELGDAIRAASARVYFELTVFSEDVTFERISDVFNNFYKISIVRTGPDLYFTQE